MALYKFVRTDATYHLARWTEQTDIEPTTPVFGYREGVDIPRLEAAIESAIAENEAARLRGEHLPEEAKDILKRLPELIRQSGAMAPAPEQPAKKSNPILKLVTGSVTDEPSAGGASITSLSSFRDRKAPKPTIVQTDFIPEPA